MTRSSGRSKSVGSNYLVLGAVNWVTPTRRYKVLSLGSTLVIYFRRIDSDNTTAIDDTALVVGSLYPVFEIQEPDERD